MAGSNSDILALLHECSTDFVKLLAHQTIVHQAARTLHDSNQRLPMDDVLAQVQVSLDQTMPHIKDPVAMTRLMTLAASIRSMTQGRIAAMEYLIDRVCTPELQAAQPKTAAAILNNAGWYKDLDAQTLIAITSPHDPMNCPSDTYASWKTTRILKMLGLGTSADIDWLRQLVDTLAVPWMLKALEKDWYDCALLMETDLYIGWIRRIELLEHYKVTYGRWAEPMREAGKRFARTLEPIKPVSSTRPTIGIFIHTATWLAHVALLHKTLSALDMRSYDIRLYVPKPLQKEMPERFAEIGIPCTFIEDTMQTDKWSPSAQFRQVRTLAQKDGVQTMIWLCLANGMQFAYGMGLAPYQVYWSMRGMMNILTTADDYWMSFNETKPVLHFQGRDWKAIPVTFEVPAKPEQTKVNQIRARYQDKIILGSLVREDKLLPDFISTVCDILDRNTNAVYLYTGREDLPHIRAIFEERGLTDRAHFVGWVDTALYAHVFDVYLDCWPTRSGVTLFNALDAEIPMLFYMGDHSDHDLSRLSFLFFELQEREQSYHLQDPLLDQSFDMPNGERALLAFATKDKYLDCADRLIRDAIYRKACGAAGRALHAYLSDKVVVQKRLGSLLENTLQPRKGQANEAA